MAQILILSCGTKTSRTPFGVIQHLEFYFWIKNLFTNDLSNLIILFYFKFLFSKMKQYTTNIACLILIYDTSFEVFYSQAITWSSSSTAPRRKSNLNVCFHTRFLHRWYGIITGPVQVIACGARMPREPHKGSKMLSFPVGWPTCWGRWRISFQSKAW